MTTVSGVAFALVVLAGLLHASWNLAAKKAASGVGFAFVSTVIGVVLWAPLGVTVLLRESGQYGRREWLLIVASAALHVGYFAVLLTGYQRADLSVVYPVARGSGPLIAVVAATVFLGESPGLFGFVGVLTIVGGVVLIASGSAGASSIGSPLIGVQFGLATGFFIAAYSLLDGYTVKRSAVSPIALDYGSNLFRMVFLALLVAVMAQREATFDLPSFARSNWRPALVVGALSPAAYILVLEAVQLSEVSKVAPARELSMVFAALFAGRFLQEADVRRRLVGAILIAAGVVVVSLS